MKGIVNYYIEEPEENYALIRGDYGKEDVYKYTLQSKEIALHDPTEVCILILKFIFNLMQISIFKYPARKFPMGDHN